MDNAGEENWRILRSLFPQGWEQEAKRSGAVARLRGFASPEALLRTLLLHVACGYSLRETVVQAKAAQLAAVSDVALLKRLRQCEPWLRQLCVQLLAENGVAMPPPLNQRTVRAVDATIVKEPGPTGSQWRIVYSLRLPELLCDYFQLLPSTGEGTGESFARVAVSRADLLLADAGYCSLPSIESAVVRGADTVVRVNPRNFPAQDRRGRKVDLLDWLGQLAEAGQSGEWDVILPGQQIAVTGKVCALRKSEQAIAKAHRRIRRRALKRQTQPLPQTWEFAKYVVVFTSWRQPAAAELLEWYRVRWQVELVFKRLKSLAQLGHLPKSDERSSRAWLYAKLFVALLTQKLVREGRDISPWGYLLAEGRPSQ